MFFFKNMHSSVGHLLPGFSSNAINALDEFFLFFLFLFSIFFSSSMHSVILNREYAMKFVMLSIFSPFTTSFKIWARFASHVISYLTDVTSVIVFPILYTLAYCLLPKVFVAT